MAETLPKLSQEFRDFLIEAKPRGYGNEGKGPKPPLHPGENGVMYSNGTFCYLDRWVGGNPYSGFEQVSVDVNGMHLPIWSMSYRETLLKGMDGVQLRGVMEKVLPRPDPDLPIRGPKLWEEDGLRYSFKSADSTSTLESFDVEEFVHDVSHGDARLRYVARFMGGLVNTDQQEDVTDKFWLQHDQA